MLIFGEHRRPFEDMALSLAKDRSDGGVYWRESCGEREEESAMAIFSVLRFEDSLSQRASAIDSFCADPSTSKQSLAKLRVLFSTDLAARGLDIVDITHVIHFDLPHNSDTYVHRAGRTGRFGRRGQVLSIITRDQEFVTQRLANKLAITMSCIGRQQ